MRRVARLGGAVIVLALCGAASAQPVLCTSYWDRRTPAVSPSPRFAVAAATFQGKALFLGGLTQSGVSSELWQWDGENWTLLASDVNIARSNAAAAPIVDNAGVEWFYVFGGVDSLFQPRSEFFRYRALDGLTGPFASGLTPRFNHAWAGVSSLGNNMLIGGGTCAGMTIEGWQVSTGGSVPVPPPAIDPGAFRRSNFALAWDGLRNRAMMSFGNVGTNACAAPDYNGQVLVGRLGDGWTTVPVPPEMGVRASHAAAYAPSPIDQFVVFGGETQAYPSADGLKGDTWQLRGDLSQWVPNVASGGPSARRSAGALVWVPDAKHFVLFGGHDGGASTEGAANGGFLGDTWVLRYDPVVLTNPTPRTLCPSISNATFDGSFQASTYTLKYWEFRYFSSAVGQWTSWQRVSLAIAGCSPATCTAFDRDRFQVLAQCTEVLRVDWLPAFGAADVAEFRYTAENGCDRNSTNAAQMRIIPDLNRTGGVNTADLVIFLGQFGQSTLPSEPLLVSDLNVDRVVNTADLVVLLGSFGTVCPP